MTYGFLFLLDIFVSIRFDVIVMISGKGLKRIMQR